MSGPARPVHPIEAESFRILEEKLDLSHLGTGARAVVARVAHASADIDLATSMVVEEAAVAAGIEAVRAGATVVADVEMVRQGITGVDAACYIGQARAADTPWATRSAAAMSIAAARHPKGAIVAVGCAPSALAAVLELADRGVFSPSLVIGVPVGFVGAASAKQAARDSPLCSITNVGDKGGSAVAAATANAIIKLARTGEGGL